MTGLAGDGVVVDGRSSSYASVWRPTGPAASAYVAVRVFTEVAGPPHRSSRTRRSTPAGSSPAGSARPTGSPRTPPHVAAVVAEHRPCALVPDGKGGWFLDVEDRRRWQRSATSATAAPEKA